MDAAAFNYIDNRRVNKMDDRIKVIVTRLQNCAHIPCSKTVTLGFDGFLDCIMRVVKNKTNQDEYDFFSSMEEFGSYIIGKSGKSCNIELKEQVTKIGGNMPILANAMGKLGFRVNCVGAMGYPKLKEQFSMISENCTLISVAEPGYTNALEFDDGKVLLAKMENLEQITWKSIIEIVGLDRLRGLFAESQLIGMLNWSEIEHSSDLWDGILNEIIPFNAPKKEQFLLFDICDCSKRNKVSISYALKQIERFAEHYTVILSMNENESRLVYQTLYDDKLCDDLECIGKRIYSRINIDILVVHPIKYSIAWDKNGMHKVDGIFIKNPKLSTGGGDNFNAGFCTGLLLKLDMPSTLLLANAMSSYYVKHGHSPDMEQLWQFLHGRETLPGQH
jgi:hypothetical protein